MTSQRLHLPPPLTWSQGSWAANGLSLGAGLVLTLAFAPTSLYWLAPVALAAAMALWLGLAPRQAFWRGLWMGVGLFGAGIYWVYHSMHVYAFMPLPMAIFVTAVLVVVLALFVGAAAAASAYLAAAGGAWAWPWVSAAVWLLSEWLRSWLLSGFPWLLLGYSQIDGPASGWAPLGGVYAMSAVVALSAAALATLRWSWRASLPTVLVAVALLGLGHRLAERPWTVPEGTPLSVVLVQGNIDQNTKWEEGALDAMLERYLRLSEPFWERDLLIWPETAIATYYDQMPEWFWNALQERLQSHRADLITGVAYAETPERYFNSMVAFSDSTSFYHKRHLVPFGEYVPLQRWLNRMLDLLKVPMSSFSAGSDQQAPLSAAGLRAGIAICYEVAYPDAARLALPGAHFLVHVSNNTWFGDTSARYQMVEMARSRAREVERPLLSATNDGLTVIIDAFGSLQHRAPQFEQTVLEAFVQPRSGMTPYARWGDAPLIWSALLIVALALWRRWR